jgi:hypothetical protein
MHRLLGEHTHIHTLKLLLNIYIYAHMLRDTELVHVCLCQASSEHTRIHKHIVRDKYKRVRILEYTSEFTHMTTLIYTRIHIRTSY